MFRCLSVGKGFEKNAGYKAVSAQKSNDIFCFITYICNYKYSDYNILVKNLRM